MGLEDVHAFPWHSEAFYNQRTECHSIEVYHLCLKASLAREKVNAAVVWREACIGLLR